VTEPGETAIVMGPQSRTWRRRLGPLAWAALEHLALAAHPDHQGWAAPVGVRDIATGIGVTKDTAARAVTVLRAAGLVTLEQLDQSDGRRRTGYRLHLPEGIQLRACPTEQDSPLQPHTDRCPDTADKNRCPNNPDSTRAARMTHVESAGRRAAHCQPRWPGPDRSPAPATQPTLFDPPSPAP